MIRSFTFNSIKLDKSSTDNFAVFVVPERNITTVSHKDVEGLGILIPAHFDYRDITIKNHAFLLNDHMLYFKEKRIRVVSKNKRLITMLYSDETTIMWKESNNISEFNHCSPCILNRKYYLYEEGHEVKAITDISKIKMAISSKATTATILECGKESV